MISREDWVLILAVLMPVFVVYFVAWIRAMRNARSAGHTARPPFEIGNPYAPGVLTIMNKDRLIVGRIFYEGDEMWANSEPTPNTDEWPEEGYWEYRHHEPYLGFNKYISGDYKKTDTEIHLYSNGEVGHQTRHIHTMIEEQDRNEQE